jgi:hypothetical protein
MMADGLFNIEILMRMSKNVREQNDGWRRDVWLEGQERAKRVLELLAMFEQEYAALDQERQRLAQYMPKPADPSMPKIITKGPADEPVQRKEGERIIQTDQVRR